MQKKPFGADWNFYDGQWVFPFGLLGLCTLYWDYDWTKAFMLVMFVVICFHIMYEHRIVFGKKEIGMRRIYNVLGFCLGIFVAYVMPIYVAVTYAIFASQLKRDGEEALLAIKKKTYTRMTLILIAVVGIHTLQGIMLIPDMKEGFAKYNQASPPVTGVPGTIAN